MVPWALAIFLPLVVGEEEPAGPGFEEARWAGMVLTVVQGAGSGRSAHCRRA
jgi:hypothetical protein